MENNFRGVGYQSGHNVLPPGAPHNFWFPPQTPTTFYQQMPPSNGLSFLNVPPPFTPQFVPSNSTPQSAPQSTLHSQGSMELRQAKKAPHFNGTSSWTEYLIQFELVAEMNRWTDSTKALELATSLRDDAVSVLGELSLEDRRQYRCLVDAISRRYEPVNLSEMYRNELKYRRRQPNETLNALALHIKQLIQRSYKDITTHMKERLARDSFIDALNDHEMEWAVLQRKPVTLDDALQCAIEYESFMVSRRHRGNDRRGIRMQSASTELYADTCASDNVSAENEQAECDEDGDHDCCYSICEEHNDILGVLRQIQNQAKFKQMNGKECFFCKRSGHFKRDCQKYKTWCQSKKQEETKQVNPKQSILNRRILGTLPPNDGLFIPVDICSVPVNCLVDTGGTLSVLHTDKYYAIPPDMRPPLQPTDGDLKMGNGSTVKAQGTATFSLQLENGSTLSFPMVVARLEVPGVLGYDFLYTFGGVLDVQQCRMTLNGQVVQCQLESRLPSLFRVTLAETISVPPQTEVFVHGDIVCEDNLRLCKSAILEPTTRLENMGICMARSLINPSNGKAPLRIVNFSNETKILHKKTTTATGELVSQISSQVVSKMDQTAMLPPYLEDLYIRSVSDIDEAQSLEVKSLLAKRSSVFSAHKFDIGHTKIVKHVINTGTALPVKQPLRRMPPLKREAIREEIDRMKAQGVIEPSASPWASPVVLVKKKDGSWRFCIDYRKLNDVTLKDSYPLPRIDDSLDALRGVGGKRWFSTMDLASGYWQVAMDPDSADRTAFISAEGLYQFKVLPFGLCNAPATFERLMESVLAGLHWTTCLIYLDDIIVFADSFEQHLSRLDEILCRLHEAGLKLSPKKCNFFQSSVKFLGHVVSSNGVSADPDKTEAIMKWPPPIDVQQVRSFLGTCSYYRRFINKFAEIAKPLQSLTLKNATFLWTKDCEDAFNKLKHAITTAPVLSYPSDTGTYILDTDASSYSIGSVLSQKQGDEEKVIAYFSQSLSKEERNYCVTRKELLAIVKSVKHFHHYLYGQQFHVRTDHGSLTWLMKFKHPEGQLARWLEILGTYDFDIEFRPGRYHTNADGLSRIPCKQCSHCSKRDIEQCQIRALTVDDRDDTSPMTASEKQLRSAQLEDADIRIILEALEHGAQRLTPEEVEGKGPVFRRYWHQWDRLIVNRGILCRKWYTADEQVTLQYIVPSSLKPTILQGLHDDKVAGHMGIAKTFKRVQDRYYWCGYHRDVEDWCRKCTVCQARMAPGKTPRAPLKKIRTGARFQRTSLDILGPLPVSNQGNRYILLITDYFSKWAEAVPLANIEACTVAQAFVEQFVSRFGVPSQVHTDQGKQFEAQLFQEMCAILGIDKTRTTPYWPQSDGFVERLNRTLEDLLSKLVDCNQQNWDACLQLAMLAYRSSVQESTGFSPCNMLYGMEVNLPIHLIYGSLPVEGHDLHEFSWNLRNRLHMVHELARDNLTLAEGVQRRQYDHKIHRLGDRVWISQTRKFKGLSQKLQMRWIGPYQVTAKLSDLTYKVKVVDGTKSLVIHHNRMKPYVERDIETDSSSGENLDASSSTSDSSSDEEAHAAMPKQTRRGRYINPPARYGDFVC